jgi:hypothetical protein
MHHQQVKLHSSQSIIGGISNPAFKKVEVPLASGATFEAP